MTAPIRDCLPFGSLRKRKPVSNYFAFEGLPRLPNQKEAAEIRKTWKNIELDAAKLGIGVFVG